MRGERGQTATEYLGLILVIGALIAALAATSLGTTVAEAVEDALCSITGDDCAGAQADEPSLIERERALEDLAAEGGGYAEMLEAAREARERGDLAEASRILDQLELYESLRENDRDDLVDRVSGVSEAEFEALVAQGTIDQGDRNSRYFRVPTSPGDGIIVMDFFIPGDSSGPLKGDGRDTVDPLLGDASLDESRIVVVIDRESGRGLITQSHTCMADIVPGNYCEDPLDIELETPGLGPQGIPGGEGNEFSVDAGDGSLEISYDALNSITPIGVSVDGTVRFERGPDGEYRVVSDTRDHYPRIVTGQYRPGHDGRIIDETDDEPVLPGALPGPVRDLIHGTGEVVDTACDLPLGPLGGIGGIVAQEVVC